MFRNNQQNTRLHALIGKLGIDKETKADLVLQFTNNRTDSSSKMYVYECQALINELQVKVNLMPKTAEEKKANDQRLKLFSIAHELGWELDNGEVDKDRLEGWVMKYGYLHKENKRMKDYTLKELPRLVTQFEYVLKSKNHAAR